MTHIEKLLEVRCKTAAEKVRANRIALMQALHDEIDPGILSEAQIDWVHDGDLAVLRFSGYLPVYASHSADSNGILSKLHFCVIRNGTTLKIGEEAIVDALVAE